MSGVTTISGVGEGTGDSSSIPRVGEGTGDSFGSELGLGCSDRARTLSLSPAGAATTPASTPRQ